MMTTISEVSYQISFKNKTPTTRMQFGVLQEGVELLRCWNDAFHLGFRYNLHACVGLRLMQLGEIVL